MTENLFERASRAKIRFDTAKGHLSVEDLWDLPLSSTNRVNLDDIARGLHRQLKDDDVSFVTNVKPGGDDTRLAFDVVKHVIDVRVAERNLAADAKDRAHRKQQILEIIARKEQGDLEGKSMDELRTLAETL